jgi:prepilin-type N-terminal cleavage/methylation domain-containing protein
MKRGRQSGLSLIEVLTSLSVIAIAFSGFIFGQVGNLKLSSNARARTELKAQAIRVIEHVTANVLKGNNSVGSSSKPLFNDYYSVCQSGLTSAPAGMRILLTDCQGELENSTYTIVSGANDTPGDLYQSEGILTITVTTTINGNTFTLGNRISCYDIYPTPTVDTPDACGSTVGGG